MLDLLVDPDPEEEEEGARTDDSELEEEEGARTDDSDLEDLGRPIGEGDFPLDCVGP